MNRTDSDPSLMNDSEYLAAAPINNSPDTLPPLDDDEIHRFQAEFSDMIDHTCEDGVSTDGNIFEHTYVPSDWYQFFFRSIVPQHESIKQHIEDDLPPNFFKYGEQEGVKYTFKVLDRRTNTLTYEQMPRYHKYGMRLLFSGPIQRELMHTRTIRKFFSKETERLGKAFDDPKSFKHIPSFVKMYKIDLNELLLSNISDYKTFNEFFYRKLKPGARPIASRDDNNIIVSAADCRLIVFENINEATKIWIKGNHFSLHSLFDDKKLAEEFDGGSIAVFRLAPVDYHRFHSPVNGRIGEQIKNINGTYYTVNPIAIKENLDVLTRNQRKMITIENETFEKVVFVAVGALLVGSVNFTVQSLQNVNKGDELGYFAYGGSTIVAVFKAGMMKWDDDLKHNSKNSMETLVRMGEQIGRKGTDAERSQYLSNWSNISGKNTTISQLFNNFPLINNVK